MKSEELKSITDKIQETLGEENSALISDDLGILITKNTEAFTDRENKAKEIETLKNDKEKLVIANGNLLKQVPMGIDETPIIGQPAKKETTNSTSLRDCFDEKGNFKR